MLNLTPQDILEAKVRLYRDFKNFEWFVPKKFETSTTAMQYLVNDDSIDDVLFGGCAGGGKSYTGWAWLVANCLAWNGINTVVVRKLLNQLTSSGIETFKEVVGNFGLVEGKHWHFNGNANVIYITLNGNLHKSTASKIWLKGVDVTKGNIEVQELGSTLYAYAFVEEAGEVPFIAYDTLAHSRLGRCPMGIKYGLHPKCFISCNPSDNWVKTVFYTPWKKGKLPDYMKFVQSFVDDNPFQTDVYKDRLNKIIDKVQRLRLRDGEWEYNTDEYDLCTPEAIEDLFYNEHAKRGKKALSSDIALQGKDKFTLLYADGMRTKIISSIDKCGGKEILELIKKKASELKVPRSQIVFDGDGVGGFLKEFLVVSNSFHNNGSPVGKHQKIEFSNLKTQCAYKLAEMVEARELYIDCDDIDLQDRIKREFKCLKRDPKQTGKLALIKKEIMKEYNNGDSTDYLDLFIMLMYFYIKETKNIEFDPSSFLIK